MIKTNSPSPARATVVLYKLQSAAIQLGSIKFPQCTLHVIIGGILHNSAGGMKQQWGHRKYKVRLVSPGHFNTGKLAVGLDRHHPSCSCPCPVHLSPLWDREVSLGVVYTGNKSDIARLKTSQAFEQSNPFKGSPGRHSQSVSCAL